MTKVNIPNSGSKIRMDNNKLVVPDNPIIPFIEGDGIGADIWASAQRVIDSAVSKAYNNTKSIHWLEVYAGDKANEVYGPNTWLPEETLDLINEYLVAIKGPLTTPIGGGIRSINVALRQRLDLYVCLRPVMWFENVPSPVKEPQKIDMAIFRENTEDIYSGIEFRANSDDTKRFLKLLEENFNERYKKNRFPESSGIGLKPVSKEGTQRLVWDAIEYAINNNRKSVTLVHKGNIMKFTEGGFKYWGYKIAEKKFSDKEFTWRQYDKIVGLKARKLLIMLRILLLQMVRSLLKML